MTLLGMLLLAVPLVQSEPENLTVLKPEDQPRKMLYKYLETESAKLIEERKRTIAALKSPDDVVKRQTELRSRFLEALGGLPEHHGRPPGAGILARRGREDRRRQLAPLL